MNEASKVILIGATGHIGSWVHWALVDAGYLVTACARYKVALPPKLAAATTWQIIDITDADSVTRAFRSRTHDAFIHLASEKFVAHAENNPAEAIEINVCGTAHVLAAAAATEVRRGVFASSWAVYGHNDGVGKKYVETDALEPATVYGSTKKIGEELCRAYAKTGSIPHISILRLFNTVGGAAYSGARSQAGFFAYVLRSMRGEGPVTIAGNDFPTPDGTCMRDFIAVQDVANAFVKSVELSGVHTFNIGSGQAHSLEEIITAFEKDSEVVIERNVTSQRPNDPSYVEADITCAQGLLSFQPKYELASMVKSSLNL
jgi:UDP-glucose 4-epimerase